jgi:hypothetical protein
MSNFTLLKEITFTNYIRRYLKSKNTRPKYFEKGKKKLPLSFCNKEMWKNQDIREPDGINYGWDEFTVIRKRKKVNVDYLIDLNTGQRVISNSKQVGTARWENINGQKILSGNVHSFEKDAMLGQIKDYFRPFLIGVTPITEFPVVLRMYVHDVLIDNEFNGGQRWDLENRFIPYSKALHDLLCEDITFADGTVQPKILPDDNTLFITAPIQPIFVPIQNGNHRKMVLQIFKDNRQEILNDLEYQFLLKKHVTKN